MKPTNILLVIGVLLVVGCTAPVISDNTEKAASVELVVKTTESRAPEFYQVVIEDFQFMPVSLEIRAGDTVEWINKMTPSKNNREDDRDVSVTFNSDFLDEKLTSGGSVAYTFKEKGRFTYQSVFNENMPENKDRIIQGIVLVS